MADFLRAVQNSKNIKSFTFDRSKVTPGICHIGVGNFHRAHLEYYTTQLLEKDPSQYNWGICGLNTIPFSQALFHNLQAQNGVYTVRACSRGECEDQTYGIGSLVQLIDGVDHPEDLFNKIADPAIKIVTMTITEGGYNTDNKTGQFKLDEPKVAADLKNPQHPTTAFGFLAEGLRRRMKHGDCPITILSCDNLQHNGRTCERAFTSFFKAQDQALYDWVKKNCTFPNSMVDRITPATKPEDIVRLNKLSGVEDKCPIYCETFIQWVVEDRFAAGRPKWEEVGVQFTDDVTPYENMKLSLLNASHQLLSYPSFYHGYRKVDEAMADKRVEKYLRDFMNIDITPYVPEPKGINLTEYKNTLIARFASRSVSDQVARLCFDGAAKVPVYLMVNVGHMVHDHKELKRVTFFFACYRHYLRQTKDFKGVEYKIDDPWFTPQDWELIRKEDPLEFLKASPFESVDLAGDNAFRTGYLAFVQQLLKEDPLVIVDQINNS